MFLSPVDKVGMPERRAWENFTIYDNGAFYAFFGTGVRSEHNWTGHADGISVARSEDGVHWTFIGRDLIPIPGAHSGFGVARIGDRILYYPTCSSKDKGVHFKIYESTDFIEWTHLGDEYDVGPDYQWYAGRWDEMDILADEEDGKTVYYGYISSEVREDIGAPSCGFLKSTDGIHWEVLPPPVIEWGEIPSHHMELNFVEKIDGRYYLNMSGRFYLDSYGYSLYTFVGDSPAGPFKPDREMFRLSGASRHNVTWLGHTIHTPDGLLVAQWLSARQEQDLPSDNFGIGSLKRLACEDGHLRLRYWSGSDNAKGEEVSLDPANLVMVHPAEAVKTDRDSIATDGSDITVSGSRDGCVVTLDGTGDAAAGFIIEGTLTALEGGRTRRASHHQAAAAGLFLESGPGTGCAILPDTLGVTRIGTLRFADHRITETDIYATSGRALVGGRGGELQGTAEFTCEDTVGPFGHASYCGIRHGKEHAFRLIARGEFFEFFIDDYYVQTFLVPQTFTGRMGLVVFDGTCRFMNVRSWEVGKLGV